MSINYSAVTIKVIHALGKDPTKSLHTRGVAENVKISTGAASMALRKLERSGMLLAEKKGNMKFYRIQLANPIARQWKVLFNITELQPLTEGLSDVTEQVVVFGSTADGTDTVESDIDLFILTENIHATKEILKKFEKHHSDRHLSPIIMDAQGYARLRRQDPALCENISRGKVLWEKE